MAEQAVEFGGEINGFRVADGKVHLALTGSVKTGLLDKLADLSAADSVFIRIAGSQQLLDLHEGSDGHNYPLADGAGRPLAERAQPAAPPASAAGEQVRLGEEEPPGPAEGDGQVHLQGPGGEELGSAAVRDENGDPVDGSARVAADGTVQQGDGEAAFVPNRPPKPAERVIIGGVNRLLAGWARAMVTPLGDTGPFVQWVAQFHSVAPCVIDTRAAVDRLQRDGISEMDITVADFLRLLGMCTVTWADGAPRGDSKKTAAEEWLRRHYPDGATAAEVARDLQILPGMALDQLEEGRAAGRLFAFSGRFITSDRVVGISVEELSELLGELERWQGVQGGQGLTIQQVAERIHVPRKVATERLHAVMKAGLVRYEDGVYTAVTRSSEGAAV